MLTWLGSSRGDAPSGDRRSRYRVCICPLGADSSARDRPSLRGGFRRSHWSVCQCASLLTFSPTALRLLVGAQPQGDVDGLHRLSHHANEILVQCFEVRLVPQLGREGFQGPSSIVLAAVEALVYERLDATALRGEQSGDQESGGHHRECGL